MIRAQLMLTRILEAILISESEYELEERIKKIIAEFEV
jgi:hypothetical protein